MQTFTHQDRRQLGQFNGRFAYRAQYSTEPFENSLLDNFVRRPGEALEDSTIRHEYLHWITFKYSRFGKQIIGQRFSVRRRFVKYSDFRAVEQYYQARTVYFACAYTVHEIVVKQLEKKFPKGRQTLNANLDRPQLRLIRDADRDCKRILLEMGVQRPGLRRFVDQVIGELFSMEYGVQTYTVGENGRPMLVEHAMPGSTQGLVNGAFSTQEITHGSSVVRFLRRFRKATNTEHGTTALSHGSLANWLSIKLVTEFNVWQKLFSFFGSTDPRREALVCYSELCHGAVEFAFRYTLNSSQRRAYWTARRLINCACIKMSSSDRINELSQIDYEVLYYFYSHGN